MKFANFIFQKCSGAVSLFKVPCEIELSPHSRAHFALRSRPHKKSGSECHSFFANSIRNRTLAAVCCSLVHSLPTSSSQGAPTVTFFYDFSAKSCEIELCLMYILPCELDIARPHKKGCSEHISFCEMLM